MVLKHKVQQSALANIESGSNHCKTSHQLDLISNNGRRPIPLALLHRIDQEPRNALPRNRRRETHTFGALVSEKRNRFWLPLLQHDRPDQDIIQPRLLHLSVHVRMVFPLMRHVRRLYRHPKQEMHVRPGVSDTEGRHGYDFTDAMGLHCGDGVGVGVGHHARGRGISGPGVVANADGVEGDDYGGGKVARGRSNCFLDV